MIVWGEVKVMRSLARNLLDFRYICARNNPYDMQLTKYKSTGFRAKSDIGKISGADLVAAISIAGILIPEAIAYAGIANLPPQAGIIALFYLPSYSPDKNTDEYLNCDLKQGLSVKPSPKNKERLKENIEKHMNFLSQSPERVKKYFKHKAIEYAA